MDIDLEVHKSTVVAQGMCIEDSYFRFGPCRLTRLTRLLVVELTALVLDHPNVRIVVRSSFSKDGNDEGMLIANQIPSDGKLDAR